MFAAALAHFVSFVIIVGAVPGGAGSGCLLAIEFFVDVAAFGVIGGAQTFQSCLSFPTDSVSMLNADQRGQYNTASTFQHPMTCGNSNADQCGQSTHVFVEDSSLLQAVQGFSDYADQCGQYHSAVSQPPPVCYARLPPNTRSDLLSVEEISVEALPRGQSAYETSAIPRVTSGLPHGAVLDAWLDSVTKQPHTSMQQSIAVAGVEERDVCSTRQPKALGPLTALPRASNILPACVRSAVTVIRPVTALPGPSAIQDLPACVDSAVFVIQPVTSLPTHLQFPEHDEIAAPVRQGSPASVRTSLVTMWTRPPLNRCPIGPSVPSLHPVLHVVLWTRPPLIRCHLGPSVPSLRPVLHVVLWTRPTLICCLVGQSVPCRLLPVVSCQ